MHFGQQRKIGLQRLRPVISLANRPGRKRDALGRTPPDRHRTLHHTRLNGSNCLADRVALNPEHRPGQPPLIEDPQMTATPFKCLNRGLRGIR